MPVEKSDPARFHTTGDITPEQAADHDYAIRSGICPNGCGRMLLEGVGQGCPVCKFWCNTPPDRAVAN